MMLEELERLSARFLDAMDRPFRRYFLDRWNLDARFCIVTGPRGVGKSTCLVQHLRDLKSAGRRVLYVQSDHVAMGQAGLYEVAEQFHLHGGDAVCFDEVHKVPGWQRELKSAYDTFPGLRLLASGSAATAVSKGAGELARRAVVLPMEILSFREFLALRAGIEVKPMPLKDLLASHEQAALEIARRCQKGGARVLGLFSQYLRVGSYPYFLEHPDAATYLLAVEQNIRAALESDLLAAHPALTGTSIARIRRLLSVLAESVPFVPDLRGLARLLDVGDERTLKLYLQYLEEAGIVRCLARSDRGLRQLEKPEKVYFHSATLCHAAAVGGSPEIGNVRETFLLSMLAPAHSVVAAPRGDFLVDGRMTIEVGGRSKSAVQVRDVPHHYLALDGIETGIRRHVPLWLFGLLY